MIMQWNKQTEAAFNSWFAAPQTAWGNWWDIVAGSTQNGHATPTTPATFAEWGFDYWNGVANQWLAYMQKQMETFSPLLPENARVAMEQFTMGQSHATHLLRVATDMWQTILNSNASPEEWQSTLQQQMEQLQQQMSSADAAKLLQNNAEMWQLYQTEMQKFVQPWLAMWLQWPEQMSTMAQSSDATGTNDNPLMAMANLYWDTYQQTVGRFANMPSLGLRRELSAKINRGFVVWQENQKISFDYQALLGGAFLAAFEAFMQKLFSMAQSGETIESQTALLALWVQIADEKYLALFHSAAYANAQSQYVNSSMALRRHQRELTEVLLRMNDLPTRSDLDEAHHNIFLLRKEVKALQKTVRDLVKANTVPADTVPADTVPAATPKARGTTATRTKKAAAKSVSKTTGATISSATKKKTTRRTKAKPADEGA